MAKKIKAKAPKSVETKDLEPKDVKDVKGGAVDIFAKLGDI